MSLLSPPPLPVLLLSATLAVGCGAPAEDGPSLGLDLRLAQSVASDVGAFQVVVLSDGRSRNCGELQSQCIKQQVRTEDLIVLQGPDGKKARALLFTAALTGGSQEISADIPVGSNYLVFIEALSRSSPPRLLGSSCNNYLDTVSATSNGRLLAAPISLQDVRCDAGDPTIAP